MVHTRPQARRAFNHILDNVFERGDGSPLKSSLIADGITDIFGLVSIDNDTINNLTYVDPVDATNIVIIQKGDKALLRIFRDYVAHCKNSGTPIDD